MTRRTLLASLFAAIGGCGGEDSGPGTAFLDCTAASCACEPGARCDFSESSCGEGSCSLACVDDNECRGSCEESCSIECSGGSLCTVTVGASGSISCSEGSTCDVTCTDECSVSCTDDSTCTLTCPGDTEPHEIPTGGSCAA